MGFTGQWFDVATGLQYNHHRWFDPATGRWLSEDPIGFTAGDGNLYRYVGNSPVSLLDFNGLASTGIPQYVAAEAAAVSAAIARHQGAFDRFVQAAANLHQKMKGKDQQAIELACKGLEKAQAVLTSERGVLNTAIKSLGGKLDPVYRAGDAGVLLSKGQNQASVLTARANEIFRFANMTPAELRPDHSQVALLNQLFHPSWNGQPVPGLSPDSMERYYEAARRVCDAGLDKSGRQLERIRILADLLGRQDW